MSGMTEPRALFLHELGDILYAEKVLVKALPKLAKEATDRVGAGVRGASRGDEAACGRCRRVFEQLGEKAKAERCPGIKEGSRLSTMSS